MSITKRLGRSHALPAHWYRPRYQQGWRTGFFRGVEHGRRLWGVDDELKYTLESLPVRDQPGGHTCRVYRDALACAGVDDRQHRP